MWPSIFGKFSKKIKPNNITCIANLQLAEQYNYQISGWIYSFGQENISLVNAEVTLAQGIK